jgi:hypothetical protein
LLDAGNAVPPTVVPVFPASGKDPLPAEAWCKPRRQKLKWSSDLLLIDKKQPLRLGQVVFYG